MRREQVVALAVAALALSLLLAPVTMGDWGEQASFSVERVDDTDVDEETPVLQYHSLSPAAQRAVESAIRSPDGHHVVYGREDFPDDFAYSDYSEPGYGLYVVVYEGQHYRLYTYAAGGFPFVYWLYELPFVLYGAVLLWVAARTARGQRSSRTAAVAALPGAVIHLLGPEFDFPLVAPKTLVAFGVVSLVALVGVLARERLAD
jgi:hypothetical protein